MKLEPTVLLVQNITGCDQRLLAPSESIGRFTVDVNGRRAGPTVGATVVKTMNLTSLAVSLLASGPLGTACK